MRRLTVLGLICALIAPAARAQVTVDLHALQALPERAAPPAATPERRAPARPQPPRPTAERTATAKHPQAHPPQAQPPHAQTATTPPPATGSTGPTIVIPPSASAPPIIAATPSPTAAQPIAAEPAAAPPALPTGAPATAAIAPIAPAPEAAPPPPPVSTQAATKAAATAAGLRVTFAAGQSELSPASAADIAQFAKAAPGGEGTTFDVRAYAAGAADDPSSARRLSLARAMTVRGALMANGIASARIFVRALGAQYGAGPPDRVDIDLLGDNASGNQ